MTKNQISSCLKMHHPKSSKKSLFRVLVSVIMRLFRLLACQIKKADIIFGDAESLGAEIFESCQSIENKFFKKISCVSPNVVPLSLNSLKRSIYNELSKYGSTQLLNEDLSLADLKLRLTKCTTKEINAALLWSAFHKNWDLVHELVKLGADISYSESIHGLTALHVASFVGCAHTTKLLASLDRSLVNRINKYYSPLHCAALSNRANTALILLDNGARIDLMTNGPEYETPLYLAVKNDAIDCVKLFVERGAHIYQEGKLGDVSPLFLAAELGRAECLKIILNQSTVDCNELRKSGSGNTALHIAAQYGHIDCIEVLLSYGANPDLLNYRKQTPLHLSVKTNSYSCVVTLVKKGNANLNIEDDNKRTPLHKAVELILDSRKDLVKFLIENGANLNAQDQHGFTPLHVAALNQLSYCTSVLIRSGADFSIKSNSGITAFSLIAKKTPSAFQAIRDQLTQHITLVRHTDALNEVEMTFDFKNGLHHPKEYWVLNSFIDAGHKEMLWHPYIVAFLFVTWRRMRRCYYGMICNSLLFSVILLVYVLTALAYDCDRKVHEASSNSTVHCTNQSILNRSLKNGPLSLETQWYILFYFTLSLIYRKVYGFYGYPSLREYCANWGNGLEWTGIINVFIISFLYTGRVETWQVHLGAFGVICSSCNVMYLIGQLPLFGPYVEMFQKVGGEFQKLLLVFFPFLVGFTIGFCIIFPNSSTFYNPIIGFISTLVMMTGDMNYNILLDYSKEEDSSNFARFTSQLLFMSFLLFVTIILMNLLVGIAVHDIQGLQKTADLSRLVRQAKMCSYVEMSHFNRSKLAIGVMSFLRVTPKPYIPELTVKPLDPLDTPIPREVIQASYDLAKNKETQKNNILNRTRSECVQRKRSQTGLARFKNKLDANNLNHLLNQLNKQSEELKCVMQEICEIKEILKGCCSPTSLKEEYLFYNPEQTAEEMKESVK